MLPDIYLEDLSGNNAMYTSDRLLPLKTEIFIA
jgi:hypothetical protein